MCYPTGVFLCLSEFNVLPVPVWVSFGASGFLPQSKDLQFRSTDYSKLPIALDSAKWSECKRKHHLLLTYFLCKQIEVAQVSHWTDAWFIVTGQFRQLTSVFIGTGIIIADLKQAGILSTLRDQLKISVNPLDRSSAHDLIVAAETRSRPAASLLFWRLNSSMKWTSFTTAWLTCYLYIPLFYNFLYFNYCKKKNAHTGVSGSLKGCPLFLFFCNLVPYCAMVLKARKLALNSQTGS